MAKNVTIRLSDQAAHWARRKAADENTSVSRLVGTMIERQMRQTDEYWAAFERWKKLVPQPGVDASQRWTREEIYEHRR
ncbi:MAG TPA: hypothetical protein VIC32_07765 [Terriglobales bacterium]